MKALRRVVGLAFVSTKAASIEAAVFASYLACLFPVQIGRHYAETPPAPIALGALAAAISLHGLGVLHARRESDRAAIFLVLFVIGGAASMMPIWFGRPWMEGHALWFTPNPRRFFLDGPVYAQWESWALCPPAVIGMSWFLIRWKPKMALVILVLATLSAHVIVAQLVDEITYDYDFFYGPVQIRQILFAAVLPYLCIGVFYAVASASRPGGSKETEDPHASKPSPASAWGMVVLFVIGIGASLAFAPSAIEQHEAAHTRRALGLYVARELAMHVRFVRAGHREPMKPPSYFSTPARLRVVGTRCWVPFIVHVRMSWAGEKESYNYNATYFWFPFIVVRLHKEHPF